MRMIKWTLIIELSVVFNRNFMLNDESHISKKKYFKRLQAEWNLNLNSFKKDKSTKSITLKFKENKKSE